MPYYFMRDTPLQALEQLMMSQPGQKPRGGGIYRSPFHYTPKDVACEYCQNYVRKHPCRLCECTCLDERIEAGVLNLNEFVRDCFAPSMGPQFRKRMHQQLRKRNPQFFLSDAHRRRWTHWRERCWRLSDRNKAALFLLTAYWHCIAAESKRTGDMVNSRKLFDDSEAAHPIEPEEYIPVENIQGKLLLIGAEDDALWDTAKYIRRMEKRLAEKPHECEIETMVYAHGTHFVFPEGMLKIMLPVGSGLFVQLAFQAAKQFPEACRQTRQDIDRCVSAAIHTWTSTE